VIAADSALFGGFPAQRAVRNGADQARGNAYGKRVVRIIIIL